MLNWIIWSICIKMDLALNNLQRLICHKTQATKPLIAFKNMLFILDMLKALFQYVYLCILFKDWLFSFFF